MKKIICISCPNGCLLEVGKKEEEIIVRGNLCFRGKEYAVSELTCPMRNIASTVKVKNGTTNILPVYTASKIQKSEIFPVMEMIRKLEVEAPIKMDEIIYEQGDILLKASCDVERR